MIKKNYFGHDLPSTEEHIHILEAGDIAYKQGGFPEEALRLLDDADDARLATYLSDHVSPGRSNRGIRNMMKNVATAVFLEAPSITEAISRIDETECEWIDDYFKKLDEELHGCKSLEAFWCLASGYDLTLATWTLNKDTGEKADRKEVKINGHLAQRRAILACEVTSREYFKAVDGHNFLLDLLRKQLAEEKAQAV